MTDPSAGDRPAADLSAGDRPAADLSAGDRPAADLSAEDAKLITLARSARARTRAAQGAAVRDGDGRTYVAATVALPSLGLTALQTAVAMAVSSGARTLEAAVVLGEDSADDAGARAVADLAPSASVLRAGVDGSLQS